jgi:hypothetical protein
MMAASMRRASFGVAIPAILQMTVVGLGKMLGGKGRPHAEGLGAGSFISTSPEQRRRLRLLQL